MSPPVAPTQAPSRIFSAWKHSNEELWEMCHKSVWQICIMFYESTIICSLQNSWKLWDVLMPRNQGPVRRQKETGGISRQIFPLVGNRPMFGHHLVGKLQSHLLKGKFMICPCQSMSNDAASHPQQIFNEIFGGLIIMWSEIYFKHFLAFPKASKGYLRNVRCIKGGLLRKDGCLANADIGPKKQHFHWKTK